MVQRQPFCIKSKFFVPIKSESDTLRKLVLWKVFIMTKKKENRKDAEVTITESDAMAERKIQTYSKALKKALEQEPPEEQVRILKIMVKAAKAKLRAAEPERENEDELVKNWEKAEYPYKNRMSNKRYEKEKLPLQVELLKLQKWVKETGKKIIIIFEGRDAAGKGGTIRTFMEHMNPRGARIVALPKPTEAEKGQWYFQRYVAHLPTRGEIVLFDRSWYNRAGVERVMGFCSDAEYVEFLRQCPQFEENLIHSDTILIKFWLSVTQEEQRRRFKSREIEPLKRWKLSPIDIASLSKWDDYSKAEEVMFFATNTTSCPWTVIKSDDKKRARLNAMRYVLSIIDYAEKDPEAIGSVDPLILSRANVKPNVASIITKKKKN